MDFESQIAALFFPKEQPYLARRKFRHTVWALIAGLAGSVFYFCFVKYATLS